MKDTVSFALLIPGAILCVWAAVLLVWNLFYFWFPSVDYKVGETDETISITGKRGETLTFLMKPGSSVGAKWGTTGITLSLTSPTLKPIEEEIVAFKEAGLG
jgi:hypothetical protein